MRTNKKDMRMEYLYEITDQDLELALTKMDVKNIHIKFVQSVVFSTESAKYQIDPTEFADFLKENSNINGNVEYGINLQTLATESTDALYRMYVKVLGQ